MNRPISSNKLFIISFLFLFLPATSALFAQTGTVRGTVIDSVSGEPVFGAGVLVPGTKFFAQTDFDGKYSLTMDPGEYDIVIKMAGYTDQTRHVKVEAGRVTALNVTMGITQAQAVIVEGRALNNTEASMMNLQRKSGSVSDGISQEAIRRSPDASAGEALRRVTGISIIGGKYIFVRGLGERYSNTLLNDVMLPSPEPDRRVVPMDLFPASLIKNIRVIKTFLPEDPAEFSGGLLKIETLEYPDEFLMTVGLGIGVNNNTTFRNFQTYRGGGQDFLGRDDGYRDPPKIVSGLPDIVPFIRGSSFGGIPTNLVSAGGITFPNNWDTYNINAPLDQDLKFTVGNTVNLSNGKKFGFLFGTSYIHKYQTTQLTDNRYGNLSTFVNFEETSLLAPFLKETSTRSQENVLWGNNLNLSLQFANNQEIYTKTFFSTNSDKYVRLSDGENSAETRRYHAQTTGWIERNILHQVFGGKHAFNFGSQPHKLTWNFGYSQAQRNEPDLKQQLWALPSGSTPLELAVRTRDTNNGSRFYSDTRDIVRTLGAGYEIPFTQWNGLASKFKLGFLDQSREKNYDSSRYQNRNVGATNATDYYPVPGSLSFNAAQFVTVKYLFEEQIGEKNSFDARSTVRAYYGQFDMPIVNKLRFIGGARYEDSYQYIVTYDRYNRGMPENDIFRPGIGELRKVDVLPSANFVWEFRTDMNLRAAYSETLARPDLRELSNFAFTPYFGGERLFGNPNLARTYIHNYDFRWEWYITPDEYIGIGVFEKQLSQPIESIGVVAAAGFGQDFTFDNARLGKINGLEFEMRKYIGKRFGAEFNLFFIKSQVDVMSWVDRELIRNGFVDLRSPRALYNPTNLTRRLQGQSDYVYNVKLSYYFSEEKKSSFSLLYNIFGDRLYSVGTKGFPDTYEKSAGIMDAVLTIHASEKLDFKIAAKNILDTRFKIVQESRLTGEEMNYRSYRVGPSFSTSLTYKF